MRRVLSAVAIAALAVSMFSPAAQAEDTPSRFGEDWDDPRSATEPIDKPATRSCEVLIVDHRFDDLDPVSGKYEPPTGCGTEWSKVVLRVEGFAAGAQSDRVGLLEVGGVPVFKTSTPEPSPDGVEWTVERDLTGYSALFANPQETVMTLPGVVDDSALGVLDMRIYLTFYATSDDHPAAESAEAVQTLTRVEKDTVDLTGELSVPTNSERLLADVYATGSGDCEETWYMSAPPDAGYSCSAENGPYREVQVLLDGEVAGIAAPYPHVYTGGWSNPFLWYTLPAPRTLDIRPITYDLTPYLGLLNDGRAHQITVKVDGLPADSAGWSTPTAFRVWRDDDVEVVNGGVLTSEVSDLSNDISLSQRGDRTSVDVEAGRQHRATGWLETSHGNVMTTVDRTVGNTSAHSWREGETPNSLRAEWFDLETRTILIGENEVDEHRVDRYYGVNGQINVDKNDRLTTNVRLTDERVITHSDETGQESSLIVADSYFGIASYDVNAPRADRQAIGASLYRSSVRGNAREGCHDHVIHTRNGFVVADRQIC